MDFEFIPPKPPDITNTSSLGSPAAYVTINDDSSSSTNYLENDSLKSKKKRKHSNKRHKVDCPKNNQKDVVIPLGQSSQNFSLSQSNNYQTPFSSTPFPLNKNEKIYYSVNDKGPFVVHVQKIIITDSVNNSNDTIDNKVVLNPIIFGKFIQRNLFPGIILGSIIRIGRNRIKISFNTYKEANDFVNNSVLVNQGYNAFVPSFCVTKMGVIKIPNEVNDEDIIKDVIVPNNHIKIIKVRRLNYKTVVNNTNIWKPSQSVVVTFEGQVLPEFIYLYFNKLMVNIYQYPTIQCFSCCRFGHTKNNCRSKPRCFKCGQNHTGDSCEVEETEANCLVCSGNHFATNKKCPEYNRQKNIKSLMSEKSISYMEANKLEPRITKSYADVLSSEAPQKISYKKNIVINSKPKKNFIIKEFDKSFHKEIAKDIYVTSAENGCALNKNSDNSESNLKNILLLLINLLKSNEPNNVEIILNDLLSPKNNNDSSPYKDCSMELSKSAK